MSKAHALVIDDNGRSVKVLLMLLAKEDVSYSEVGHPSQLESVLETLDAVDVVFLDLEMPNRDGFEVRDVLRADSRFDGIPIIAYTVHVSEIDRTYEQGFDGFIGKPLDSDRFPEQLERILNGEAVWETA